MKDKEREATAEVIVQIPKNNIFFTLQLIVIKKV